MFNRLRVAPPGPRVADGGAALRERHLERRLLTRDRGIGLLQKLWQIPWSFVLLLCAVAAVGYVALYSAGGGAPEPYAAKHALRFGFGLVMMVSIGLVDIRVIARFAWLGYAGGVALLVLVLLHGNIGKGAQRWIDIGHCSCSHPS